MPSTPWYELSPEHKKYLVDAAIPDPERWGVRSVLRLDDVPTPFEHYPYGQAVVPSLVFPFSDPDGSSALQLRPDVPLTFDNGDVGKYLWPAGQEMLLGHWLPVVATTDAVLIVEGTKQSLAAASYAPPDTAVLGMFGCRGWYRWGSPNPSLRVVSGRAVYIVLDSDAASNRAVYDAGAALRDACSMYGAVSVAFVRVPGAQSTGLDDVLATMPADERAPALERLISTAKSKPADAKPAAGKGKKEGNRIAGTPERPVVVVNEDRLAVINALTDALVARHDGDRLFNFGGSISQRDDAAMAIVTKDGFPDLLANTVTTISRAGDGDDARDSYAWPDANTMVGVLSRAAAFSPLDKIAEAPFLRPDGTVCALPGYDAATKTFLILSAGMDAVSVPEQPTGDDVASAMALLTGDLLIDFPFLTPADLANALATLLTPFMRLLVPTSPLAVIDGMEAGSGKNLFADVVSLVATGRVAEPLPYSDQDEEQRKVITATFRRGASLFVFDEAHSIGGASLARALTAHTYQDRVLGSSTMLDFPNNVTWMSLGNQVEIRGDLGRRVYRVRLEWSGESPEHRTGFRHPDLRGWARTDRARLVSACLTLLRAWFAAGSPEAAVPFSFGSFEAWQRVIGGVLAHAGVDGFLSNVSEWRSESDYERAETSAFLEWLFDHFVDREFTTAEVAARLRADKTSDRPHGLTDTSGEEYPKRLGMAMAKMTGRVVEGFSLRKSGVGHRKLRRWSISGPPDPLTSVGSDMEGTEGPPYSPMRRKKSTFTRESNSSDTESDENIATESDEPTTAVEKYTFPQTVGGQVGVTTTTPVPPLTAAYPSVHPAVKRWLVAPTRWEPECERCEAAEELIPAPIPFIYACRRCHPATFEGATA